MIFLDVLLRFFELGNSCDLYFECLKRYFELVHLSQPCGGQKGANFSTNWGNFKLLCCLRLRTSCTFVIRILLLLQNSKLRIGYLNHVEQEGVLISIEQVNLKVTYRIYASTFFTLEIDIIRSVIDKLPIRAQPVWSKNDFQCIRCSPHWLNHLWSLNCVNYWTKNCANGLGTVKSLKIAYYQPLWSNYFL